MNCALGHVGVLSGIVKVGCDVALGLVFGVNGGLLWCVGEMSYAAFKMVHCPTGVDNCVAAYVTHSAGETDSDSVPLPGAELIASGGYWASTPRDAAGGSGPPPNLVITKANVLEVFHVRLLEGDDSTANGTNDAGNPETTPRGGLMAGLSYVKLELACHYRFSFIRNSHHSTVIVTNTIERALLVALRNFLVKRICNFNSMVEFH